MHTSDPHPASIKTGPLMAQVVAACVAGGLLGSAAAYISGWGGGDLQTIATATLVPTTIWIIAAIIGAMLLSVVTHNEPAKLGMGVLASSTARMLIALMAGVLLYFLMSLEGRSFWTSFLLAGLFALVAETTWAIRLLNTSRLNAATGVR